MGFLVHKTHRLFGTCAAIALVAAHAPAATPVEKRLSNHIRILASDKFEGRLPGSRGETLTKAYIVDQFRAIGLKPGGETVNGRRTWFQTVPTLSIAFNGTPRAALSGDTNFALNHGIEMVLRPNEITQGAAIKDAPLVFVGFGIDARAHGWDDFKDVDLKGKVAVYLFGEPKDASGKALIAAPPGSAHATGRAKAHAFIKRGAVGMLMVHEPEVLNYTWRTSVNAALQVRQDLPSSDPANEMLALDGFVRNDVAAKLLTPAGTIDTLKKRVADPAFRPVELGSRLSTELSTEVRRITSQTVIGLLKGKARPAETIIIGAHWDHQGMGAPDAQGDTVYNGAIDNASGVSGLIEIARAVKSGGGTARSVAFVSWTLEEPGILGSEYYARNPVFPLETTAAVIALDTLIPLGRARDFSQNADPNSELTALLEQAGKRQQRTLTIEPHPELFLRGRSDHFPLAKRGVPPVFFLAGEDLIDGGRAKTKAYFDRYFAERYHQQGDDFEESFDFAGTAQDVALLADFIRTLGKSRLWPEWLEDGSYKAVRNASAAQRR